MFDSIKHRMPGGYLYDKTRLHKKIKKAFPEDVLAECLYRLWKYRYWHLFNSMDEEAFLKKYFPNRFLEIAGCQLSYPKKEDIDTFLWEYPDLILPLLAKQYDYSAMETLFDEGPYEWNEEICVKEGDVVIDCGANLGFFCSAVSKRAEHIYAFEPAQKLCEQYLEPLQDVYPNITIVKRGLAAESGVREFCFYPDSCGSSYLSTEQTEIQQPNGNEVWEKISISCISLDDFVEEQGLEHVDFIKADIEGAERELLQGAQKTLARFAPKLAICTYHLPDDKEVLEQLILQANPKYSVYHGYKKLYAYVKK